MHVTKSKVVIGVLAGVLALLIAFKPSILDNLFIGLGLAAVTAHFASSLWRFQVPIPDSEYRMMERQASDVQGQHIPLHEADTVAEHGQNKEHKVVGELEPSKVEDNNQQPQTESRGDLEVATPKYQELERQHSLLEDFKTMAHDVYEEALEILDPGQEMAGDVYLVTNKMEKRL